MSLWALLAPGPSASAGLAARVAHLPVGAIGNAFELVPSPAFIAASDGAWWRKHPLARTWPGPKYSILPAPGVEEVKLATHQTVNSGVLGLECAKRAGATRILLLGFDMHGSHFFGPYTNGLRNTAPHQREEHQRQYEAWRRANPRLEVVNCTPGSALRAFPMDELDACLA